MVRFVAGFVAQFVAPCSPPEPIWPAADSVTMVAMSITHRALQIYAGPRAMEKLRRGGLQATDVRVVPAAAGGPKGLILGRLDRFLFGDWLGQALHPVHLVGASIGAWRMATACLPNAVAAFARLEHDYIRQDYAVEPGKSRPTPEHISQRFGEGLRSFYDGQVGAVLEHPRFHLHVVTSRGRHALLQREGRWRTPLGYLGAVLANAVSRQSLGHWLDRVVFSQPGAALPFASADLPTHQVVLSEANFFDALQASCSIPFVLRAVPHIHGAPSGAYWDGGITDYHMHLQFAPPGGVVLYPHFQKQVVPGWLDKPLKWRHKATAALDDVVVLAPKAEWVARLPNAKLPDRSDFARYVGDLPARIAAWQFAADESQRLADEFAQWLERPNMDGVMPL